MLSAIRSLRIALSLALACGLSISCAQIHRPKMAVVESALPLAPEAPAGMRGVASAPEGAILGAPVQSASAARRMSGGAFAASGGGTAQPAPAGQSSPQAPAKPSNRKVIYSGSLTLRVANKISGREEIDRIVKKFDGLIATATLDEVTFRVAPDRFEAAMDELARTGEVAAREIKSEDVTDQFFDLSLRIEVAEGSKNRLMELLGKSGAVKDVLEVERDLRRLTEEIETLKGALRRMQDQIDLATIRIRLEEKQMVVQPRRHSMGSIFAWMNEVGLDRTLAGASPDAPLKGELTLARLVLGPRFRLAAENDALLPPGFLPVLYDATELLGVTAQDDRLRVQRFRLRQDGELAYWADALAEEFKSQRGYIVRAREEVKMDDARLKAVVLRCETAVGGEPWDYDVWLVQRAGAPEKLVTVEFARTRKAGAAALPAVERAVRGLRLRSWH